MKLEKYLSVIKEAELFKNLSEASIVNLFNSLDYTIQSYSKDEVIFVEDDECFHLSLILDGTIEIQKIDLNGKVLSVAKFGPGEVFGELLIFSNNNHFPMTVVSKQNSIVLHIKRESVLRICQAEMSFLFAYLRMISEKAFILNKKLKEVTLRTIREQVSEFLLEEAEKQKSNIIKLPLTKKEWADKIGVQRPSLSRELIKMQEDGIISMSKNTIEILDIESLY